jgi:NitT/TauT family transport system substrate-binding protein
LIRVVPKDAAPLHGTSQQRRRILDRRQSLVADQLGGFGEAEIGDITAHGICLFARKMCAGSCAGGMSRGRRFKWRSTPSVACSNCSFEQGKIDAFLGFPPEPQDLRARHIGHVIVNTAVDRPWSQYFCCLLAGNANYVRAYPVATKRVLRAVLKAADLCAAEPARVARQLVDGGFTSRYDYAAQTLSELPYDKWREYDAEDTIRFYALHMQETGFVRSSPQKIIADGTDWRFLTELKRELKT